MSRIGCFSEFLYGVSDKHPNMRTMTHLQIQRIAEYLAFFVLLVLVTPLFGQQYKKDYSGLDCKRHARKSTKYCILHTTEGNDRSSLAAVKRQGTCNYLVTTDGVIHQIISSNKVAKHAGVTMWCGHSNLSNSSIGIEVVGYHNKKPNKKQLKAIAALIKKIKSEYGLRDDKFITHSMAAYAPPNQYWDYKERGRKRCGMLFATPAIRVQLGLKNTFCSDPDVVAGRIHNDADPYLANILYCGKKQVCVINRPAKGILQVKGSDDETFEGFRTIGKVGARKIAGSEYDAPTTIYFLTNGKIRTGAELKKCKELNNLDPKTKVLVGYVYGGKIGPDRTAYSIVHGNWDDVSTFYRFHDGSVRNGDEIKEKDLVTGTIVLFRQ